jgi:endonuclease YncB( thermonuclease family)
MKKLLCVIAGLLVSTCLFPKEVLSGKIVTVIDGNTVELVAEDNETYKIKLHGIDCPQLGQEYGDKAKRYLERLLLDRPVSVEMKGKDRWGTRLGIVIIDGEVDPRYELLKEGLAWTAEVNPNPELEGIRAKAKELGKGLWKDPNPTPPWKYRRQQTLTQFKSS